MISDWDTAVLINQLLNPPHEAVVPSREDMLFLQTALPYTFRLSVVGVRTCGLVIRLTKGREPRLMPTGKEAG